MNEEYTASLASVRISKALLLAAVVTLPFTAAGTLDIGFSLKFYEGAIALLFFIYITKFALFQKTEVILSRQERRALYLAGAYLVVAFVSSVFGYFVLAEFKNTIVIDSWRHDPSVASGLKCGYLFLDIFTLFYIVGAKNIRIDQICNYWMIGGLLAACYGWYLFTVSLAGHEPPVLPGQDHLQVGGPLFPQAIRCGTFLEGNFVATFYLISAVLGFAMLFRTWKWRYGLAGSTFLFSIIHTQSTCGIVAAAGFIVLLCFFVGMGSQKHFVMMLPVFGVLCLAAAAASYTPFVQEVVEEKISADDGSGNVAMSRLEREDSIRSGYEMFLDYPILGIGLSNFGFLFPYYTHFDVRNGFDVAADKSISNNIYSEVSTETGSVGFIVFASFCIYVVFLYWKSARGLMEKVILAGLFSLFVAWIAYPTFSLLFQWVFFALAIRIFLERDKSKA